MLVLFAGAPAQGADFFNKSYAVVVGISNYRNANKWQKLDNAENDAKAMKEFLASQGFKVKSFIGAEATRDNIVSYMEDTLAPKLTQNDRFVFYFSGHGSTLKNVGGQDRGYLIPYDGETEQKASSWLSMEKLQELADKLDNARHQLFILDSCFGGLFAKKGYMSTIPENTPSYITAVTGNRARQYLTAGGVNEETPTFSNLENYKSYSYYTAYLLKGLKEGAADTYQDGGFITASELDAYLGPAATTKDNKPRGGSFPGHEQGNFVFRSPKKPAQMTGGSPPHGPVKGMQPKQIDEDKHDWEMLSKLGVDGLRAYLDKHPNGKWADEARERIDRLQAAKKLLRNQPAFNAPAPVSLNAQAPAYNARRSASVKTLSEEEQAQALSEWETDIQYTSQSQTVEKFLQRFPEGSHVPDAQRKLDELRAIGQ